MKIEPDSPYSVSLASATASLLVVERHHRDDRAEDLLAPDRLRGVVRLDHLGGSQKPAPPGAEPVKATVDLVEVALHRSRWPAEISGPISLSSSAGVQHPQRPDRRLEPAEELVVRRALDEDPGAGAAVLPGVVEDGVRRAGGRRRRRRRRRRRCWRSCRPARGSPASPGRRSPAMICLPTSVEPVKQTLRTSGWVTKRCPTTEPWPGITVSTPCGSPASRASSPSRIAVSGVSSAGLSTTVLPAASAGREAPAGDGHREVPRHDHPDDAERLVEGEVDAAGAPGSAGRTAARARRSSS